MTWSILWWVLYIVGFLIGCYGASRCTPENRINWAPGLLVYILIGLLGWAVFGPVVNGSPGQERTQRTRYAG